ncbi:MULTISPECIES: sensor histidine kinase [Sphingobacterium]|nr:MULTISPECIES: HAMP domain-containing sensor histidine kinase [unclassified Sphingobacterium]
MNEIISDFVNSITHEYKTPISTIKVCVKNLQREAVDKLRMDTIISGLSIIERQSDRLNNLMDKVIYASMFDPVCIEKTEQPIVQDLETVLNDLRLKFQLNEKIIIHSHLEAKDLYIKYNLFLFTTVLINLVQNAVKFNDSDFIQVIVELKEIDDRLSLSVSDNGIGISEEDQKRVFDRFYQGKTSRNRGGIGLGLYYVRRLVVTHNWTIEVRSKLNTGTTFKITIPKYK